MGICTWDISTIILALYGYILGIQSCYMSLKFGQYISFILYSWWAEHEHDENNNNKDNEEIFIIEQEHLQDEVEEEKQQETDEKFKKDHDTIISTQEYIHIFIPFLLVIPLFIFFLYQSITTTIDQSSSIHKRNAYREMWLSCFFSPIGAIMRYKLSFYFNKSC